MADPETPAELLARATEARGIAERMQRARVRKTMIEIAAGYERLAGYAGSATRRAFSTTPSSAGSQFCTRLWA